MFGRILLGVILAFAFLLRVWDPGRHGLWYDEILQAQAAGGPLAELIPQWILHAAMPLDYLIERGVLLLGKNELLLRFSSAAASTLAVALIYKLGRAMFGERVGLAAAAYIAVSSFAVFYAHEARPYSLYMLWAVACLYWLYRALHTNRLPHWLYFGISVAGLVLTHLFSLFVVMAMGLFILTGLLVRAIAPRRAPLFARITRRAMVGGALVVALFLVALWLTPNAQFVWGSSLRFFAFLLSPQFLPRELWYGLAAGETPPLLTFDFFYSRILENFSGGGIVATATFVGLGLVGLTAIRSKPWEIILLAFWAILPSLLIVLFLGSRGTLFAARYLIASVPAWLVLCALGTIILADVLSRLAPHRQWVGRGITFVLALLVVGILFSRTMPVMAAPKEDWRTAGKVLDLNVQPGDRVIAPGGTHVVYFYAPRAAAFKSPAETRAQIVELANHAPRVWIVLNRYVFDPGDEIRAWLESVGAIPLKADSGITLYYWRPRTDHRTLLDEAQQLQLPPSSFAHASLGEQLAQANDLTSARAEFARALDESTSGHTRAMVYVTWGDVERRAGSADAAAEHFRSALALDSASGVAWLGLGRAYLEQDQLDAAKAALLRALNLDPQSYAALFFLGEAHERSGEVQAAQAYYARAAELVPELITPP